MSSFALFHQLYERTKPQAFYVGVEEWSLPVFSRYTSSRIVPLFECELRFGYNFFYNGKDRITPIIGGGFIKNLQEYHSSVWDSKTQQFESEDYEVPALGYAVIGFLYDHEFNTIFNLGFNFKGMIGGGSSDSCFEWGSAVVGLDMALPITFRFGYKRHWDYRIEPFYQYLYGSENSISYLGFRGTLGYRF